MKMNINIITIIISLVFLFNCSATEKTTKENYYTCYPEITAFEIFSESKKLSWIVLDEKTELLTYFKNNFKFSPDLEIKFCEKNMFFDFTFEVDKYGKIINTEIERKFYLEHFEEIKYFFESIPKLDVTKLLDNRNYRYWIRIGVKNELRKKTKK